jgi:hypothetical protein
MILIISSKIPNFMHLIILILHYTQIPHAQEKFMEKLNS